MKAVQIKKTGNPDVLEYIDIEQPSPGKGQVLVKTEAIGVTFGDIMVQRGVYPIMPTLPATLGFECSGIVESVGEGVSNIKIGQSVAVLGVAGCYAEYVVADEAMVFSVPDTIDKNLVAAFPITYLTAYHLLHTMGNVQAGQTVLIYGAAGGVGTAVIQLAKMVGVNVIGVTSSEDKVNYAKQQGADYVINYKTDDIIKVVNKITDGKGVNLILNSIAGDSFGNDFNNLATMGQIVWFGFAAGFPQANLTELLGGSFMKSSGIRTFTLYNVFAIPDLFSKSMRTLINYLTENKIKPHIHEVLPLSEADRAHKLLEGSSVKGRLILVP